MRINNILSTVSLCRRAGKLIIGFDAVIAEIGSARFDPKKSEKNSGGGILLACDVSPKTEKEVRFYAERRGCEVIKAEFSMDDARGAIGKRAGVFLVTDEGLFGSIRKHMQI